MVIRGDSSGMTSQMLQQQTIVTGIWNPGAKLHLSGVTPSPQDPAKGTCCYVLITGTIDLSAGDSDNIHISWRAALINGPPTPS